jgi:uncharacterized repeat protein (TIGR04076 family)
MDLIVTVREVRGTCPVYKEGDTFKIEEGYRLRSEMPLCMHALSSIMPFYNALRVSGPELWGLASDENQGKAYIQCPDALPYTGGGTVFFEIARSPASD